jgi:hypothetical protein
MSKRLFITFAAVLVCLGTALPLIAADFNLFGRSGDAIEINLASLPGVSARSTFSGFNTSGLADRLPSHSENRS